MVIRFTLALIFTTALAFAEGPRSSYQDSPDDDSVIASPRSPWTDEMLSAEERPRPWWAEVLLYVPNRVLDLIDVFKLDVGLGPTFGGVVRVTQYGQAGFRQPIPFSLRGGLFGRRLPVLLETSNELGVSPAFSRSKDRQVCKGEVGLGLDAVVGVYGGICFDEVADFALGLFLVDFKDDDL